MTFINIEYPSKRDWFVWDEWEIFASYTLKRFLLLISFLKHSGLSNWKEQRIFYLP